MTEPDRLSNHTVDGLVVSPGPAGINAALYLARAHRSVQIIDAGGSRARWIAQMHNFPVATSRMTGTELLQFMRKQTGECDGARLELLGSSTPLRRAKAR